MRIGRHAFTYGMHSRASREFPVLEGVCVRMMPFRVDPYNQIVQCSLNLVTRNCVRARVAPSLQLPRT